MAIVQSCYIPWKGYFDLINSVDEFVLLDDVQYTTRDWRNRNRIKSAQGPVWLTIPIAQRSGQRIDEAAVADRGWAARHWRTIARSYARAPHFATNAAALEELYLGCDEARLSRINRRFLELLCDLLGIRTPITSSADHRVEGRRTERLLALLRATGATEYLSGPSARSYLEEERFAEADIRLTYFDYSNYPVYPQLHPPFEHAVSAIDLLFNVGPEASAFMLSFGS